MREVILNYWNWFADLVNPYHDVINTISTIVIAAFAVVLARVAWKQTRDARILQRAYLNVKFGGIQSNSAGELVGHVTFQNVGHLPARKLYWLVKLNRGGSDSRPPKIKSKELVGENVIPIGAEWPQGSKGLADHVPHQDEMGLYLYLWGRVIYKDGFRWRKRKTDFCHCYPWQMRTELSDGGVKVGTEYARYHAFGHEAALKQSVKLKLRDCRSGEVFGPS